MEYNLGVPENSRSFLNNLYYIKVFCFKRIINFSFFVVFIWFRLVLGDAILDVTMGIRGGFLQELASIQTEGENPSLSVLGQLSHRLVCTPDMEYLLLHER